MTDTKTLALPLPVPPAMPLAGACTITLADLVDADQVRTDLEVDDELQQLADDIAIRGMRQPIEVRPGPNGRWLITTGHRRALAAALAGKTTIPAIAHTIDENDLVEHQLAENIHRADLSLADMATAIAKLYAKHGSLAAIADIVHKSVPWVSKHLSASRPDFGSTARRLLESGKCEDLELLGIVSQIEKHNIGWHQLHALAEQIERRKAGRAEARKVLEVVRAKADAYAAETKALRATKKTSKKDQAPPAPPPWSAHRALNDLHDAILGQTHIDVRQLLEQYTPAQAVAMADHLQPTYDLGAKLAGLTQVQQLRALSMFATQYPDLAQSASWILGAAQITLTLENLAVELDQLVKIEE